MYYSVIHCVVYVCLSLSVCVFVFGLGVHVCVFVCMYLRSSAKALKPTKMFCCAVQHMATHPLYAGQRELSSTLPRYCSQCFCTGTVFAVALLIYLQRVTLK